MLHLLNHIHIIQLIYQIINKNIRIILQHSDLENVDVTYCLSFINLNCLIYN